MSYSKTKFEIDTKLIPMVYYALFATEPERAIHEFSDRFTILAAYNSNLPSNLMSAEQIKIETKHREGVGQVWVTLPKNPGRVRNYVNRLVFAYDKEFSCPQYYIVSKGKLKLVRPTDEIIECGTEDKLIESYHKYKPALSEDAEALRQISRASKECVN